MLRFVFAGLVALAPVAVHAQTEQQQTVDRASLAAQDLLNDQEGRDAQYVLRRARAVMICPQVFRAGFLFGGQGGTCVLTARDGGRVVVGAGLLWAWRREHRLPGRDAGRAGRCS